MSPDPSGATPQPVPAAIEAEASSCGRWLAAIIAFGFGLRLLLVLLAENRLDCDESTVALMSLDILERGERPMFFYGGAYNGGGAVEAYLGALAAALGGGPPLGLKWVVALLWLGAAGFFANLCQRSLPRPQALVAVLFLAVGTPFFLEWSIKARGGFSETLLLSVILLWLAHPPPGLARRPILQSTLFGLTSGLALWASEMILPMLPCAALWLLSRIAPERRLRSATLLLISAIIGVLPLLIYNLGHDWEHLRQSAMAAVLVADSKPPLELSAMALSFRFVLGSAAWLLVACSLIGAVRILRRRNHLELGHVLLAHAVLYLGAYWVSGQRFLEIAPSRVLYPLQLDLAVLLACAIDWRPGIPRRLSAAALVSWLLLALVSTSTWIASRVPRDHGSWRASWCGVDGNALRMTLLDEGIDAAYLSYWTATPVVLANRMALRGDPSARKVLVSTHMDGDWGTPRKVAFVLNEGSPVLGEVETALQQASTEHERSRFGGLVILSGIDARSLESVEGLPESLSDRSWPPRRDPLDGFN